jgi:hypothetical protein
MKTRDESDDQTDQHACSHCGDQTTKTSPAKREGRQEILY